MRAVFFFCLLGIEPHPALPWGVWDSGWELGKKWVTHRTIWLVTSGASRIKAFGLRGALALGTGRPWPWVGAIAHVRPGTGLAHFPVSFLFSYWGQLLVRASYGYVFSDSPTPGQTRTALLSHGAEMMEMEVGMGEVGFGAGTAPPMCLRLTFSRRWAAACRGQSEDCEPDGPQGGEGLSAWETFPGVSDGGSTTPPTPPWAPRTHRNLVCWRLCAPVICRYTSFSCRAREGCEARALGEPPQPEDLLGMAGSVATGMRSGSTLLEAFTVWADPRVTSPATHVSQEALLSHLDASRPHGGFPLPSRHPAHTRPRGARCPGPTGSLHSPPPPGAAGRILECQVSAGSRCRGGRAAGTVRRALGQAGRGVISLSTVGTAEAPSSRSRARIGGHWGRVPLRKGSRWPGLCLHPTPREKRNAGSRAGEQ